MQHLIISSTCQLSFLSIVLHDPRFYWLQAFLKFILWLFPDYRYRCCRPGCDSCHLEPLCMYSVIIRLFDDMLIILYQGHRCLFLCSARPIAFLASFGVNRYPFPLSLLPSNAKSLSIHPPFSCDLPPGRPMHWFFRFVSDQPYRYRYFISAAVLYDRLVGYRWIGRQCAVVRSTSKHRLVGLTPDCLCDMGTEADVVPNDCYSCLTRIMTWRSCPATPLSFIPFLSLYGHWLWTIFFWSYQIQLWFLYRLDRC